MKHEEKMQRWGEGILKVEVNCPLGVGWSSSLCAGGFQLSELISLALGAAAFGVAPSYLSALEQQQVCPCTAVLRVSIQSPSRKMGAFWPWVVLVWKGSFLADLSEKAVGPEVICGYFTVLAGAGGMRARCGVGRGQCHAAVSWGSKGK